MKKSMIATLVAVPVLSISSMAFAAEPVLLSAAEMDGVTAGTYSRTSVRQFNLSSVTFTQASAGNLAIGGEGGSSGAGGSASAGNQIGVVLVGNVSVIRRSNAPVPVVM
ncbi:MAG: hypothetical protein JWQ21_3639 [Herminiimonas sp.]|nr:hypothetical protein [Herminiimonas sp.]